MTSIKYWWARVGVGYGRWAPTGYIDKQAAEAYLHDYYHGVAPYVIEWLQL